MKKNRLSKLFEERKKYIIMFVIIVAIITAFSIKNINKAVSVEAYSINPGTLKDTYKENAVISFGRRTCKNIEQRSCISKTVKTEQFGLIYGKKRRKRYRKADGYIAYGVYKRTRFKS